MFVCLRAYLKNHMAKLRFQCISTVSMVQSSSKYSSWVACIRAKSAIYGCLVAIVPLDCPFLCPPLCQNSGAAHAQCRGIIVIESFCIRVAVFQYILEHVYNVGNEAGVGHFCGFAYLSPNWLPRRHLLSVWKKRLHLLPILKIW